MARSERVALAALCALGAGACNFIAGIGQFHDVDCEPCTEAGRFDSGAPTMDGQATLDATGATAIEAGVFDAGEDAPPMNEGNPDASDAATDAGDSSLPPPDSGPSVDYRWARWIMPNGAEAGLPNPASYTAVPGIDGGVYDTVTHLTWGNAQLGVADAGGACPAPWRVPTRIELVSILDTSQPSVLVNPVFTGIQAFTYWTSSVTLQGQAWTVSFSDGKIAYAQTNPTGVICVQAPTGVSP